MSIEQMYVPASIKNGISLGIAVKLGVSIMQQLDKGVLHMPGSNAIAGTKMGDAHVANMIRQELEDNIGGK